MPHLTLLRYDGLGGCLGPWSPGRGRLVPWQMEIMMNQIATIDLPKASRLMIKTLIIAAILVTSAQAQPKPDPSRPPDLGPSFRWVTPGQEPIIFTPAQREFLNSPGSQKIMRAIIIQMQKEADDMRGGFTWTTTTSKGELRNWRKKSGSSRGNINKTP